MRHLSIARCVLCFVCCTGFAAPVWAQGGAAPEPAPTNPPPPPEPGSALAALLSPPVVAEAVPGVVAVDDRPVRSGFVFGAGLGLSLAIAGTAEVQPSLGPGIAVGFKIDRAVITLGAEFANLRTSVVSAARNGDKSSVAKTDSTFLIVPGVQLGLLRSRDGRVEFLGAVRFGLGTPTSDTSLNPAPPATTPSSLSTSRFSFMYELAPGVRYWAHRNFGINLLAGFRGDYLFLTTSGSFPKDMTVTSVTSASTTGTNGIFASIGGIGVF